AERSGNGFWGGPEGRPREFRADGSQFGAVASTCLASRGFNFLATKRGDPRTISRKPVSLGTFCTRNPRHAGFSDGTDPTAAVRRAQPTERFRPGPPARAPLSQFSPRTARTAASP